MNVLSYFDGCSGAQQALERLDFKVDNYFACEIDKYAIQVTQKNYPNTIQLGSVIGLDLSQLPKIDLFCGGSPCQSFSFAGKRKGMATKSEIEILSLTHYLQLKNDGFEFEGQSYLFWEFMHALTELRKVNQDIKFFLENVEMGEKWEMVISKAIGVNGIHFNSALVSAQNRKRIYWTNIGMEPWGLFGELESVITMPKDKGILLKDILEKEVASKYYLSEKVINKMFAGMDLNKKSNTLRVGGHCSQTDKHNFDLIKIDKKGNIKNDQNKASCFTAGGHSGGNHSDMDYIVAMRGRNELNPSDRKKGCTTKQMLEFRKDNKTNCLTSVQKDNLAYSAFGADYRKDEGLRVRENGKSGTLSARARNDESCGQLAVYNTSIRRLTPIECERLQTMKDNFTEGVSDSQRYKMIGNGWNIDSICIFFSYLKFE